MSSRLFTTLRVIAGAIVGAIAGSLLVLVVSTVVAEAIGRVDGIGHEGGGAAGMIIMLYGVPFAIIGGAILGGWAAGAGRASSIVRFTAVAALALTGLAIVLIIVLPDNHPRPVVDAKGCAISPRIGSFVTGGRHVVVYDRYCRGGEGHTVNVSVVRTGRDSIVGPGNVLVLAGELEGVTANNVAAYVKFLGPTRLVVQFDHRARVLAQSSPVLGFDVTLSPDIGLPPRPDTSPPPPAVQAMIDAERERFKPRGASSPGSSTVTDAEGCLNHPQLTLDKHGRHFAVYDRLCASAPHRTMNVSLIAPEAPLAGAGNVLALNLDGAPQAMVTGQMMSVWLDLSDPHHLAIRYDDQLRVVSQGRPADDLDITLHPHRRGNP